MLNEIWNDSIIKSRINGHLYPWFVQIQSCLVTDIFLVQWSWGDTSLTMNSLGGYLKYFFSHICTFIPQPFIEYLLCTAYQDTEMSETLCSLCLRQSGIPCQCT